MNDVHYLIIYSTIFLLLGLISPLINDEFNADLTSEDIESQNQEYQEYSTLTIWSVIGNIFLMPFWTFGLPWWVNLWILLPIRVPFIFLIARNIWIGGGN